MDKITIENIRAQLAELDAAYHAIPDVAQQVTDAQRERFDEAQFNLHINLSKKLHLLLDTIDSLSASDNSPSEG